METAPRPHFPPSRLAGIKGLTTARIGKGGRRHCHALQAGLLTHTASTEANLAISTKRTNSSSQQFCF